MVTKATAIQNMQDLIQEDVSSRGWLERVRAGVYQLGGLYGFDAQSVLHGMRLVPGTAIENWHKDALDDFVAFLAGSNDWVAAEAFGKVSYANRATNVQNGQTLSVDLGI